MFCGTGREDEWNPQRTDLALIKCLLRRTAQITWPKAERVGTDTVLQGRQPDLRKQLASLLLSTPIK